MSMPERKKSYRLQDQQVALTSYLAALLQDVPEYIEEQTEPEVQTQAPVAEAPSPVKAPAAPPPVAQVPAVFTPAQQPAAPVVDEPAPATGPATPAWAQERFQCLVFQVAGLSLAVPLTKLNGVVPWPEAVTPMPNRSALFLGLMRHQQRNVKVVDTALMVLPEGRQPDSLAAPEERLQHVILLDEGRWGLACDSIGEVLTLEPDEVRWRGAQGKRPWLAGTVLEHLCALLDADAFVELLLHGERGS